MHVLAICEAFTNTAKIKPKRKNTTHWVLTVFLGFFWFFLINEIKNSELVREKVVGFESVFFNLVTGIF